MEQKVFSKVLENNKVNRPVFLNCLKSFIMGGLICLISEIFLNIYNKLFDFNYDDSKSLMYITIIFISAILTGFGIFDKIGQFSGAGTIVPITGFANSMTSSALESKSEGIILGILTNMFKLAGAVIVSGVVSAIFFGTIIYLFRS